MTDQEINQKQRRLCDYCNESTALLYCRADSAKLCFSCDREVHSANQLFTRHARSQLCDACDDSPASIFCETDQSVFCSNCDWERESHKFPSSSLHKRRPIEGFTGCPSVTELVSFVGVDDLGDKAPILSEREGGHGEDDGWLDLSSWETPVVSSFDDLLVSSDFDHGFKPTDVLPLPKNRNASCGQHKVEVIHQLRELAKSEPTLGFGKTVLEAIDGFQPRMPDADNLQPGTVHTSFKNDTNPILLPAYESSALRCFNDNVETTSQVFVPISQLIDHTEETAVVPDKHPGSSKTTPLSDSLENQLQLQNDAGTTSALPKVAVHELNSQERETAISRYKEKRKTRRFGKHIRYESRKVRADSRTRIKGRFAKIER
ncbi:membrane-anchored ubiquitin-fold protein 3-like isoform X1 [Hibiscus syriacus]|uniref:Membrane-anchored ubiquitin-fold protein 3-like isoform X1 n=1 Tax=Hibiscus syriacus TaxID=106335 RepID=A0A6A2Z3Y6_HIBSY|nr:zinc finger protein CONSTANS-LIKE 13-like [Hibiscus syriacus]KAE8686129.1 membrane-anchored ubiquitin-fold protein 3-like isoform X1 [Hibiscus syriacus]